MLTSNTVQKAQPLHTVHNFLRADLALAHVLQTVGDRAEPAFPQLDRERLHQALLDEARDLLQELDHMCAIVQRYWVLR